MCFNMVAQDGNAPSNHRYERCGLLLAYRAIVMTTMVILVIFYHYLYFYPCMWESASGSLDTTIVDCQVSYYLHHRLYGQVVV